MRRGPASPMPLADALQLLVDGAEAGPLPGLVGPALLHEPEHGVGAQLRAGQAAPCGDGHRMPAVRRGRGPAASGAFGEQRGLLMKRHRSQGAALPGPQAHRGSDLGPTVGQPVSLCKPVRWVCRRDVFSPRPRYEGEVSYTGLAQKGAGSAAAATGGLLLCPVGPSGDPGEPGRALGRRCGSDAATCGDALPFSTNSRVC